MKKFALAAAIAGSLVAAPAIADTKAPAADPFVSTQGGLGFGAGMAAIGVVTVAVIVAATDGT